MCMCVRVWGGGEGGEYSMLFLVSLLHKAEDSLPYRYEAGNKAIVECPGLLTANGSSLTLPKVTLTKCILPVCQQSLSETRKH